MQRLYKLTNEQGFTRNRTPWQIGIRHEARGVGNVLCTDGVLHAYSDPLVAILMNPLHANFLSPRMYLVLGDVAASDGIKVGSKFQKCVARLDVPAPSVEVRVIFGILCGLSVFYNEPWRQWAFAWLSGKDRSRNSASYSAIAADAIKSVDFSRLADLAFQIAGDGYQAVEARGDMPWTS